MSAVRWLGGVGVAMAALMLGACASVPSGPATPSRTAASVEATVAPTEKPADTASPVAEEAVITVAAVDVDGLNVTISGYVSGVIQSGGRCAYFLTSGDAEVGAETVGAPDRASTTCGSVQVSTADLTRGTWEARLEYTGDDGEVVVSEPIAVEVP